MVVRKGLYFVCIVGYVFFGRWYIGFGIIVRVDLLMGIRCRGVL